MKSDGILTLNCLDFMLIKVKVRYCSHMQEIHQLDSALHMM